MKVNFAHLRDKNTEGGWIDYVVFDAHADSNTNADNGLLLHKLTRRARASGLKVDQSALAYRHDGKVVYFGVEALVKYLGKVGVQGWTHTLDLNDPDEESQP
jgi:arginase family enzyme